MPSIYHHYPRLRGYEVGVHYQLFEESLLKRRSGKMQVEYDVFTSLEEIFDAKHCLVLWTPSLKRRKLHVYSDFSL